MAYGMLAEVPTTEGWLTKRVRVPRTQTGLARVVETIDGETYNYDQARNLRIVPVEDTWGAFTAIVLEDGREIDPSEASNLRWVPEEEAS
jgi:hypothetical protein